LTARRMVASVVWHPTVAPFAFDEPPADCTVTVAAKVTMPAVRAKAHNTIIASRAVHTMTAFRAITAKLAQTSCTTSSEFPITVTADARRAACGTVLALWAKHPNRHRRAAGFTSP
jgi:hypothetical protein